MAFPSFADTRFTVLIMAANRRGPENPVARLAGTSHKCIAPVAGMPMIDRVLTTISRWGKAGRILVSIEDAGVLDAAPKAVRMREAGDLEVVKSGKNLADSVLKACEQLDAADYPLLITTGDNVLHTTEVLEDFCSVILGSDADAGLALVSYDTVARRLPEEAPKVGYLRFAEGQHSNCNIYLLKSEAAVPLVRTMRDGGQFRHYPFRILRAFGLIPMIKYQLGRARISDIETSLERMFHIRFKAVLLDHPFAPIDVDSAGTLALAERLLRETDGADA